jgi:hypothetical protein
MPSLRTALALTLTAAAATLVPAAAAVAATPAPAGTAAPDAALPLQGALPAQGAAGGLGAAVGTMRNLPLDPLSNTGVDPLDNGVGTQVADFKPLSTTAVTDQVTRGGSLGTLPVAGPASGMLAG